MLGLNLFWLPIFGKRAGGGSIPGDIGEGSASFLSGDYTVPLGSYRGIGYAVTVYPQKDMLTMPLGINIHYV